MRYGRPVKLSFGVPAVLCAASLALAPARAGAAASEPGDPAAAAGAATLLTQEPDQPAAKLEGGNPFSRITLRNAFGIKPPAPPAPEVPVVVSNPPVNLPIFVTGFSLLRGVKKVYLVVNRPGSKTPDYITAKEGEEFDGFQVVAIDPKQESVRVLNGGTEATLNFKDNGMKPVAASAAPGGAIPVPGGRRGAVQAAAAAGGGATIIGGGRGSQNVITGGVAPQPNFANPVEIGGRGSVITSGGFDPTVPAVITPAGGYTPPAGGNPVIPVPRTRPAPPPPPLPQ